MNTKNITIIILAAVLILGGGAWIYLKNAPQTPTIVEKLVEEETEEYSIYLVYPQIRNLQDTDIQVALNEEFTPNLDETRDYLITLWEEELEWRNASQLEISQSFTTHFVSQTLLSIEFTHRDYLGGAHAGMTTSVANYNLSSGKEILLQNVFKKDSDYIQTLSNISTTELTNRLEDDILFIDGAGPDEENFTNFVITKDSLIIIFVPYQVAPFSEGFQEVEIPYSRIENIIDKNGPLRQLL
jgi:hypothetical protein